MNLCTELSMLSACRVDGFVCKEVKITSLDREKFQIKAQLNGETFDLAKHEQGTEIKVCMLRIAYAAQHSA
jgi:hypothetical protein